MFSPKGSSTNTPTSGPLPSEAAATTRTVQSKSPTSTKVVSSVGGGLGNEAAAAAAAEQREILLWIRLLFLCYYGSLGSLMPYLPVYYDSLGHGGAIIGLLGAVKPATCVSSKYTVQC
jgi:MFS_1 like family